MQKTFGLIAIILFALSMLMLSCEKKPQKPVYLNLIWHQHQPSYEDTRTRSLIGPWVRTHATKDYFDMAYRLKKYPNLHMTINLTSVLLTQLQHYYIDRLKPYIHLANEEFRVDEFKNRFGGRTDPWLDLLTTPTSQLTKKQRDYLYNWSGNQAWNCFSISEHTIKWFPEYIELIPEGVSVGSFTGIKKRQDFTIEEKRKLKFLFNLANFDPMFLRGSVALPIRNERGEQIYSRVHRWIRYESGDTLDPSDDRYYLKEKITEEDCQQLVVEIYKVLLSVVKIHKRLQYDPFLHKGQIELITTPYYHPILPLIYDSEIMKQNQPDDLSPQPFRYPEDARWQVREGIELYKTTFGRLPVGMWPGEGSVSKDVIHLFADEGISWIATGPQVLVKSLKKDDMGNLSKDELSTFYNIKGQNNSNIVGMFRDLGISDDIAFNYPNMQPRQSVKDFVKKILSYSESSHAEPIVTVLLDGENCWEHFRYSHDGTEFLDYFYYSLDSLQKEGQIITVTPSEYIFGNPERKISAHKATTMPIIEDLWPGCWFAPDFKIWIGEEEENIAWEYLGKARKVFDDLNLTYNPDHPNKWIKRAWKEMFAAEGSDWFWWYGNDQTAPGGADAAFDINFRLHLNNVFYYLARAGFNVVKPEFPPIINANINPETFKPFVKQPRINGYLDKVWKEGAMVVDDDGGAQFTASDYIKVLYGGFKDSTLYVALDAGSLHLENQLKQDSVIVRIYVFKPTQKAIPFDQKSNRLSNKTVPDLIDRFYAVYDDEKGFMMNDTTLQIGIRGGRMEIAWPGFIHHYPDLNGVKIFAQILFHNKVDFAPNAGFLNVWWRKN
ncbi:MAG: hypothetical protein Kow00108_11540 [Calditrichia bacterium]